MLNLKPNYLIPQPLIHNSSTLKPKLFDKHDSSNTFSNFDVHNFWDKSILFESFVLILNLIPEEERRGWQKDEVPHSSLSKFKT